MKRRINTGDRVKFLNDVGGGTVRAIQDDEMALVERDDGFEVPCLISELIPDRGQKDYGTGDDPNLESTRETKSFRLEPPEMQIPSRDKKPRSDLDSEPHKEEETLETERNEKTGSQDEGWIESVDLHIHHLVDNPGQFQSGELVEMQLAHFEMALQGAIKSGQWRIVFIHGAGSGMLKYRLRRILDEQYPKLRYQDASFREYGYGATMVILPSKKRK